jgi:hypothetical protein
MAWMEGCKASASAAETQKNYAVHIKKVKPKPNQYHLMDGRDLDLSTGLGGGDGKLGRAAGVLSLTYL